MAVASFFLVFFSAHNHFLCRLSVRQWHGSCELYTSRHNIICNILNSYTLCVRYILYCSLSLVGLVYCTSNSVAFTSGARHSVFVGVSYPLHFTFIFISWAFLLHSHFFCASALTSCVFRLARIVFGILRLRCIDGIVST